jgi:hypothetical protein
MTISRSLPTSTAAAMCVATLALALTACGSNGSDAGSTQPTRNTHAPALSNVDAPTGPHTLPHRTRCFPGGHCAE